MWFFVQLCSSWQDFNWVKASRGPSAIAELLVESGNMVHKHTNKKRTNRQIDSVGKKLNKMKMHNTHNKRWTMKHRKTHKNADGLTDWSIFLQDRYYAYSRDPGRTFYNYESPCQTRVNTVLATSPLQYTVVFGVPKEFLHTFVIAIFKFHHNTTAEMCPQCNTIQTDTVSSKYRYLYMLWTVSEPLY